MKCKKERLLEIDVFLRTFANVVWCHSLVCLPVPTLKPCMCSLSKSSGRNVTLFDISYFEWKCPVGAKCTYQNNVRYRPWFPKYIQILSSVPLPSLGCFCGSVVKSGEVVVILVERVVQRLVVEQDGCFWWQCLRAMGLECWRHSWQWLRVRGVGSWHLQGSTGEQP